MADNGCLRERDTGGIQFTRLIFFSTIPSTNTRIPGGTMPYVNIKVTSGPEAPTAEQKAELIKGATDLLARVLGKNPATTVVVIDEVPMENWGIGGESVTVRRKKAAAGKI
jgi:4-oxalocrotonate tautomerase